MFGRRRELLAVVRTTYSSFGNKEVNIGTDSSYQAEVEGPHLLHSTIIGKRRSPSGSTRHPHDFHWSHLRHARGAPASLTIKDAEYRQAFRLGQRVDCVYTTEAHPLPLCHSDSH